MASDNDEPSDTGVPSNDAYTGMLVISLLALIVGSVLLFIDYSQYGGKAPTVSALPPLPVPQKVDVEPKKDGVQQPPPDKKGGEE